jgi:hypothetical protein
VAFRPQLTGISSSAPVAAIMPLSKRSARLALFHKVFCAQRARMMNASEGRAVAVSTAPLRSLAR